MASTSDHNSLGSFCSPHNNNGSFKEIDGLLWHQPPYPILDMVHSSGPRSPMVPTSHYGSNGLDCGILIIATFHSEELRVHTCAFI